MTDRYKTLSNNTLVPAVYGDIDHFDRFENLLLVSFLFCVVFVFARVFVCVCLCM